jgi:assimilatory nitrate reductase catalytic subunit
VVRGAGGLVAALYVTRSGQLPDRAWIAAQLGTPGGTAIEWLAARPSTPAPDAGPMVCVCYGVGEKAIAAAIAAGAASVAAVGAACQAGTNCGSCRPALARMIAQTQRTKEAVA